MKIILIQDVKNVGTKNQIVDVSDGYAKNFLIRNHFGVACTESAMKKLNSQLKQEAQDEQKVRSEYLLIKKELEQTVYEFELKCHNGVPFGTISTKQIVEKVNVNKKLINKFMFTDAHSWTVGPNTIKLKLYNDIYANINISVKEIK